MFLLFLNTMPSSIQACLLQSNPAPFELSEDFQLVESHYVHDSECCCMLLCWRWPQGKDGQPRKLLNLVEKCVGWEFSVKYVNFALVAMGTCA